MGGENNNDVDMNFLLVLCEKKIAQNMKILIIYSCCMYKF